jgi:hypothetical protein
VHLGPKQVEHHPVDHGFGGGRVGRVTRFGRGHDIPNRAGSLSPERLDRAKNIRAVTKIADA